MSRKKILYALRVRDNDSDVWGKPDYYSTRKERDTAEKYCRILGGIRTHSYEEQVAQNELAEALNAQEDRDSE